MAPNKLVIPPPHSALSHTETWEHPWERSRLFFVSSEWSMYDAFGPDVIHAWLACYTRNWLGGLQHIPHLSKHEVEIISPLPPRTTMGASKKMVKMKSAWKLKNSPSGGSVITVAISLIIPCLPLPPTTPCGTGALVPRL